MKQTKLDVQNDRILVHYESELEFDIPELVEFEKQEFIRELRQRVREMAK